MEIVRAGLSCNHFNIVFSVLANLAGSNLVRNMKGRPSDKVRCEFQQFKSDTGAYVFGAGVAFQKSTVPSPRILNAST